MEKIIESNNEKLLLNSQESLAEALKALILKSCNLHTVKIAEFKNEMPLFKDGLGLDSIDLLEIVVAVEKTYGYRVKNDEEGRRVLVNIETLTKAVWDFTHP